jgi:hypothetical protein
MTMPESVPMHCPFCEADNPEGMKFCIECAAPVTLFQFGAVHVQAGPLDMTGGAGYYREALTLADNPSIHPLIAHYHHSFGQLYAPIGCRAEARTALPAAIELYRTMDMMFWLRQAEAVLEQVDGR